MTQNFLLLNAIKHYTLNNDFKTEILSFANIFFTKFLLWHSFLFCANILLPLVFFIFTKMSL